MIRRNFLAAAVASVAGLFGTKAVEAKPATKGTANMLLWAAAYQNPKLEALIQYRDKTFLLHDIHLEVQETLYTGEVRVTIRGWRKA